MTSGGGLWQRLDDIDRRLGLYRSVEQEQRVVRQWRRWWRVYLGAGLVLLVIPIVLYVTGNTAGANITMGLPGMCAFQALDGWSADRRLRRDAERAGAAEPPE